MAGSKWASFNIFKRWRDTIESNSNHVSRASTMLPPDAEPRSEKPLTDGPPGRSSTNNTEHSGGPWDNEKGAHNSITMPPHASSFGSRAGETGATAAGAAEATGAATTSTESNDQQNQQQQQQQQQQHHHLHLPHVSELLPPWESGRKGFHPFHFLHVVFKSTSAISMAVNLLWPFVPAGIVTHFVIPEHHTTVFALNYLAIVPAANLIGFAGQELARKLPHVLGLMLETTLGSVVEIVLFMVLIKTGDGNANVPVIKAAILGSILANLLLCLGACFFVGGFLRVEQTFNETVSETCNGLMLIAGTCLVAPAAFASIFGTQQTDANGLFLNAQVQHLMNSVSRSTAVLLLVAYAIFMMFQQSSHHSLYQQVFEQDELADSSHRAHLLKKKLTMTECIIALALAIACVALSAIFLVQEIEPLVSEKNISDAFMGLILVPLVEKAAEHLTAVDEAYDNQANLALSHVMGASVQTALLNTPLVVMVGWGLHKDMDLNFRPFEAIILILAIIVVGNFLRDCKSNYLEGALCIVVYVVIAIAAWFYPNTDTLNSLMRATSTDLIKGEL